MATDEPRTLVSTLHRSPASENNELVYDDKSHELAVSNFDELSEEERKDERNLVWRLDLIFLAYGFVGACFKSIDQSNISNAYVSGMKEDLSLYGNELNYFTTYFNVGYIIMLYPSIIIMSWIGPHYWLPSLELVWGVLTCFLSIVKDYKQVYVVRAFIGLAEGSAWPGFFTLLSLWYTPQEIAKRGALYGTAGYAASMFSGVLQAALYKTLNGVDGRAGWRWLFLVNGVLTIFVALFGYFCFPGFPDRPNPLARFWLRERHLRAANRRLSRIKRQHVKPLTFRRFGRVFLRWELWVFGILCWGSMTMNYGYSYFNLYLKSLKKPNGTKLYTVEQLNYIPLAGSALAIVWTLILCSISDRTGHRMGFAQLNGLIVIFGAVIIGIHSDSIALKYVGFLAAYAGQAGFYILWSWISDVCSYSSDLRTILYATGTTGSYIYSATVTPHAWQAKLAPNWKIGPWITVGTISFNVLVALPTAYILSRRQRQKQEQWAAHPETIPEPKGIFPVQGRSD